MSIGVPCLGIAKAALELFVEKLPNRRAANLDGEFLRDVTSTHQQAANASLKIETAAMHFYHVADHLDSCAESGQYMDKSERVKLLANIGYAVQACKEAIDILKPDWEPIEWTMEERALGNTYWGDSVQDKPENNITIEA
jgi:3-hydroxy-9,10-secoandrosta-1,3,5(10)-triene-9,17-dione monooxygenase